MDVGLWGFGRFATLSLPSILQEHWHVWANQTSVHYLVLCIPATSEA